MLAKNLLNETLPLENLLGWRQLTLAGVTIPFINITLKQIFFGGTMPQLVADGLNLALYGMGTVFVFLTLLVFATRLMSWLVLRFAPAPTEAAIKEATAASSTTGAQAARASTLALDQASGQHRKLAAIAAALHLHRILRRDPQQNDSHNNL